MRDPLRIAVLGSGRGSNFHAILSAMHEGRIPNADVRLVISNNSKAGILELASANGIPAEHLSEKQCGSEEAFVARLLTLLQRHEINFIVLAGYMKRVPRRVIEQFRHRIINIHPALLPKFGGPGMYGTHVHEAVIRYGDRVSGATVHLVDEAYDHGAIVLQKSVAVEPHDTAESLAAKVLKIEHEIYPEAIRMIAEGRA
ncbi:MAG: phosphoribosylglycinamide formyltransferase [Ignavibacteriae bacterium]|nr:phosphoribosylglycinamide formyltransferase [Ignavibacteriota bacterium]